MDCFYINLDHATKRRESIEQSFHQHKKDGWTLNRFTAMDVKYVQENGVLGNCRDTEKAYWLSCRNLILEQCHDQNPIFLLDDDMIFGPRTCHAVEGVIHQLSAAQQPWDMIFTEIGITQIDGMLDLLRLKRSLRAKNEIILRDLNTVTWAGSTAYIINGASKKKIAHMLEWEGILNIPYDLWLREKISKGQLSGYFIFPFMNSFSNCCYESSIQTHHTKLTDLLWTQYRRMMWDQADLSKELPMIQHINDHVLDDELRMFSVLFAAMASAQFVNK
jgi:GR25 family glycosyltransferase involved in LPS biosynthesis